VCTLKNLSMRSQLDWVLATSFIATFMCVSYLWTAFSEVTALTFIFTYLSPGTRMCCILTVVKISGLIVGINSREDKL
jgi:hypothetical protein